MKIIFGTTNNRKIRDFFNVINELNLDIEILSLSDIGWNLGEIEETGKTIEENSLIKAQAIYDFCIQNDIHYPIITDDAGLFVDYLNGEPGIYTGRYADTELLLDKTLPKYQCVIKLLNKLNGVRNRDAFYKCVVTCMMPDGTYVQEMGKTDGMIAEKIVGELKKPYFYSVFIAKEFMKVFDKLTEEELKNTYRFNALRKILSKI